MRNIHDNDVNNLNEYNLLNNILNPYKRTKNTSSRCSPILHGFMNTRRGLGKTYFQVF